MRTRGIDRLIALLNTHPSEIDRVVKAANDDDTISISFKDGEVLILTAETETGDLEESTPPTITTS